MMGIKTHGNSLRYLEAARQQHCCDQKYAGKGDLDDDQKGLNSLPLGADCAPPATLIFERGTEICLR